MHNSIPDRILYIGPVSPEHGGPAPGGVATYCWDLAHQAADHGYDTHLLTRTVSTSAGTGVSLIPIPDRHKIGQAIRGLRIWLRRKQIRRLAHLSIRERLYVFRSTAFLEDIVEQVRPDLIHLHSFHDLHGLGLKLLFPTLPIVVTDHAFWHGGTRKKDIKKLQSLVVQADYLIFGSRWAQRQFKTYGLYSSALIKVVLNPQDPEKIPLLDRETVRTRLGLGDKKILLFSGVGEPVSRKGLDILLEAIAQDPDLKRSCKIIVITNKLGMDFANDYISRHGLDMLILGPQPWPRIIEYYNSADIFIMPSRSESFGLVYAEALLSGTPVIGFSPIIKELENLFNIQIGEGFAAGSETITDLAQKIKKVFQSDFNRALIRNRVIEHLSWTVLFPELDTIYRSLLKSKY